MIYRKTGPVALGQSGFNYEQVGLVMDVTNLSLSTDFSFV